MTTRTMTKIFLLLALISLLGTAEAIDFQEFSTGTVNVFIFTGPQSWTDIAVSTDTQDVAVSSCAIIRGDSADCYRACMNPNGTLIQSPAPWVPCP